MGLLLLCLELLVSLVDTLCNSWVSFSVFAFCEFISFLLLNMSILLCALVQLTVLAMSVEAVLKLVNKNGKIPFCDLEEAFCSRNNH